MRYFARSAWDIGTTPFFPWWEIEGIRTGFYWFREFQATL
jgi:hypothetical protein